jgi:hypothetical protein
VLAPGLGTPSPRGCSWLRADEFARVLGAGIVGTIAGASGGTGGQVLQALIRPLAAMAGNKTDIGSLIGGGGLPSNAMSASRHSDLC